MKVSKLGIAMGCILFTGTAYAQIAPVNTMYLSDDNCATMLSATKSLTFPLTVSTCYKPPVTGSKICAASAALRLVGSPVGAPATDQFTITAHSNPAIAASDMTLWHVLVGNVITATSTLATDDLGSYEDNGGSGGVVTTANVPIQIAQTTIGGTVATASSGLAIELFSPDIVAWVDAVGVPTCDIVDMDDDDPNIPVATAPSSAFRIGIRAFADAVPVMTISSLGIMLLALAGIGRVVSRRKKV